MSTHSFDTKEAEKYGTDSAVLLSNIRFWLEHNQANEKHEHDGYYWTFNSAKAFGKLFPYMSERSIARNLQRLRDAGVIKIGNFNDKGYDRTQWYTIPAEFATKSLQPNNDAICQNGKTICQNGKTICQNGEPIPDINTNTKPDIKPREDSLEVQNPAVGVEITTNISAEITPPVEQFAEAQSPVQTVQEPKAKSDNKSWSWVEFNFAFALSYLISKNRVDATARIDGINMTLWHEWMQSRKANKAKMTENALTTCLQDLIEINNAGLDANIAMQEAIKRDWLGLGHWIQKMKPKGNFAQSKPNRDFANQPKYELPPEKAGISGFNTGDVIDSTVSTGFYGFIGGNNAR